MSSGSAGPARHERPDRVEPGGELRDEGYEPTITSRARVSRLVRLRG
jgi:hypothetical protein